MKNLYKFSIVILLLFSSILEAQTEVSNDFANQVNSVFSAINKGNVPDGILLDYGMEFTNVPLFNGTLSDSTYINSKNIREIYNTLLMSRIRDVSTGFVTPQTFDSNWQQARSKDFISLAGLFFKYSSYADNAISGGKLQYTNGKFYDVAGQNPYIENKAFAIAPPIDSYTGYRVSVKLPQAIFYSNSGSEIQKIEIDLGDGSGYRPVGFDQIITANYTNEGIKTWLYRLTLASGETLLAQSKIMIYQGLDIYNADMDVLEVKKAQASAVIGVPGSIFSKTIYATASLSGTSPGKAIILVDDAQNDGIRKPLIVVEGFDMDRVFSPENMNGQQDFQNFRKNVYATSSGLQPIITGNDWKAPNDQIYDIIYVKWQNGMDYIQNNAYVLQEVIKWVNNQKTLNGSSEKNVIIGQSMGGLVVRYALRDLELKGQTHQTRLFVNQDGPQQGANVPLGYQAAYRHVSNLYVGAPVALFAGQVIVPIFGGAPLSTYASILEQPATRQLVKNRFDSNYGLENSFYNNFQTELRSKGYPSNEGIRNIAISNGSECGNTQNFNAGDKLLGFNYYKGLSFWGDLLSLVYNPIGGLLAGTLLTNSGLIGTGILGLIPGHSKYSIDIYCNSVSYASNSILYHNKISYTKKILWIGPQITSNIVNKNIYQPSGVLPFDYYQGSYINIYRYTGKLNPPLGTISGKGNFTLVPTPSALDIGNGNVALSDADYKTSYTGSNPPAAPKNTPFANFITAYNGDDSQNGNEYHLQLTLRNGDWLAGEINSSPFTASCSFMCTNPQINGPYQFCTSATYSVSAGADSYLWSVSGGNSSVVLSSTVSNTVVLSAINNFSGYVQLSAVLNTNQCGSTTITKQVWIGTPKIIMPNSSCSNPDDTVCFNNNYSMQLNRPNNVVVDGLGMESNSNISTDYEWEKVTGNFSFVSSGNGYISTVTNNGTKVIGRMAIIQPTTSYNIQVRVHAKNNCGWGPWKNIFFQNVNGMLRTVASDVFMVSPNPSKDIVHITPINEYNSPLNDSEVTGELYDNLGTLQRKIKIRNNEATLLVSDLLPNTYILKIIYGGKVETHKIIIK